MRAGVRRVAGLAMFSGVLVGTCALGYGVSRITNPGTDATATHAVVITPPSATRSGRPSATPRRSPPHQVTAPLPASRPHAVLPPGPRLLGPRDRGPAVRDPPAR